MGTNYYFLDGTHCGKRSASGLYCFDCSTTLHKKGPEGVHYSCHHTDPMCNCEWYDSCPNCGKTYKTEGLDNSSAGRELGFNKKPYSKKKGVASCSSFTWAIPPKDLEKKRKTIKIKNEYGEKFTLEEFKKILEECPLQYYHMLGQEFS